MSAHAPVVAAILAEIAPVMAHQRQAMARSGCLSVVSHTNLQVLMLLENQGPLPMSRLADLLDVSLPNLTGIVGRMEERRLVERSRNAADRRVVQVDITPGGRAAVQEADATRLEHLAAILEAMGPADRSTCLRAFRALRMTAERLHATGHFETVDHEHPRCHATRAAGPRSALAPTT